MPLVLSGIFSQGSFRVLYREHGAAWEGDDGQGNARRGFGSGGSITGCSKRGYMTKVAEPQFIESTAGQVAAELARRGIEPNQHVTVVIEPDDWIAEARPFSRPKVIEAGWSDADIDRLIKLAQQEVEPLLPK